MIDYLLGVFWFLLPAGVANMAPVLFARVPFLDYPLDFGVKFKGKRVLGANKTIRGVVMGVLGSTVVVWLQKLSYGFVNGFSLIDYSTVNVLLLGFLLGFGALMGDAVKSFFKRRIGIKPGKSWMPFDQIDWIIGGLVFGGFYVSVDLRMWVVGILLFFVLHLIVRQIGFSLGMVKKKF